MQHKNKSDQLIAIHEVPLVEALSLCKEHPYTTTLNLLPHSFCCQTMGERSGSLQSDSLESSTSNNSSVVHTGREGAIGRIQEIKNSLRHTLDTNKIFKEREAKIDEPEKSDLLETASDSPPPSPPKEVLPDRLYALYDFSGPDPNHLSVKRNNAVKLLNDSDKYWWFVQLIDEEETLGFVPAECLETFEERLARLNCWKNEEIEKNKPDLSDIISTKKSTKSVSFADLCSEINQHEESRREESKEELLSEQFECRPLVIGKRLSADEFFIRKVHNLGVTHSSDSIGTYSTSASEDETVEIHSKANIPQSQKSINIASNITDTESTLSDRSFEKHSFTNSSNLSFNNKNNLHPAMNQIFESLIEEFDSLERLILVRTRSSGVCTTSMDSA